MTLLINGNPQESMYSFNFNDVKKTNISTQSWSVTSCVIKLEPVTLVLVQGPGPASVGPWWLRGVGSHFVTPHRPSLRQPLKLCRVSVTGVIQLKVSTQNSLQLSNTKRQRQWVSEWSDINNNQQSPPLLHNGPDHNSVSLYSVFVCNELYA